MGSSVCRDLQLEGLKILVEELEISQEGLVTIHDDHLIPPFFVVGDEF